MMLLSPYRVLDLTNDLGFLAGKIFGDLGAEVIKVEPPTGDFSRQRPPLLNKESSTRQSLYWQAYNSNKQGITLDLSQGKGRELFLRLAKTVDFVIESFRPGQLREWDLDYETLRRENPGLILVSITPFGQEGPYRDFAASDLEIMALSGAMSLAGEKDGEPMRGSVPQAPMWVGAEAVMGALTALAYRSVTGRGQHVDVSAQVAVMAALAHALKDAKMRVMWSCKDGWLNFIIYGGAAGRHTNQQLAAWMDEKGMAPEWFMNIDWTTFTVTDIDQEAVDRLEAPIADFFSTLTKQEFLAGAMQREILGYPVATVRDIYADEQLRARRFWHEADDPDSGVKLKHPGGFAIFNGERLQIRQPAPNIGQHNREIYENDLGLSEREIAQLQVEGVI